VDQREKVALKKRLSRSQLQQLIATLEPTLIGMESCATAHYWARECRKHGHTVRLIAPQFVKPYVKGNKNDANDASAICEAISRPDMRFVEVKTVEQQSLQAQQRVRSRQIKARTALVNEVRGLLGEFGILFAHAGVSCVRKTLPRLVEDADNSLTVSLRELLQGLYEELVAIDARIDQLEQLMQVQSQGDERIERLQQIEGIGPITACAIVAAVGNARQFNSGRDFAAWLGIVPKQHSSGAKEQLLGISKRGDARLRTLLIHGARAVVNHSHSKTDRRSEWINALVGRRNKNIATVALANKNARIIWAMLARDEHYRASK
jgi:transposase